MNIDRILILLDVILIIILLQQAGYDAGQRNAALGKQRYHVITNTVVNVVTNTVVNVVTNVDIEFKKN